MSARALLKAVETRLRSSSVLDDPEGRLCGIRPDGRPPPNAGQLYYAIWWNRCQARMEQTVVDYTDVDHAVTITITARVGFIPQDRRGKVVRESGDLLDLAEAIAAPGLIHGNYAAVFATANTNIDGAGSTTNGFIEPLWLIGYGPVMEKGPAWIGAENGKDIYAIDIAFGRARRLTLG